MFSHWVRAGLAVAVLGGLPALAGAQDKKVLVEFGGGGTFPLGNTGKAVSIGGNFTAGLEIYANEKVSLQLQYQYSRFDVKGNLFDVTAFDANHAMQYVDLNVVYASHGHHENGPYLAFGGGAYYRKVDITKFDGYSGGAVCNPWLFVCYPVGAPVEHVVGARSRWAFGLDVGAGMQFQVTRSAHVFLESRYHYVFGPSFDTPTGSQKATGQYVPISLGIRF
jgi:opacity protein-like surface antigen